MFQQMKKRIKNQKGLTLIELLAVIVIMAIISAIAIPAIGNIINNSRDKAIMSEAMNIVSGAKIAHTSGDCDANTVGDCSNTKIGTFVDGLPTGVTFTVDLDGTNGWTVTYSRFTDLKKTYTGISGNKVTETALKGIMD